MTSRIHVQRGQKQKKGHDKLLLHGHSPMAGEFTRFSSEIGAGVLSPPLLQAAVCADTPGASYGLPTSIKPVDDANLTSNTSPWNGILRSKARRSQTRAYRPCGNCRMEEDKPAQYISVLSPSILLPSFQVSLVVGLLSTYADSAACHALRRHVLIASAVRGPMLCG
jgi:hypothetical protein